MDSSVPFLSEARREDGAPDALVLHCSDHRFQSGFREFLAEGLGLSSYALIAIPGGGHFLSMEYLFPKLAKTGLESMSFHIKRAKPHRVILIGHDDCRFFKERLEFYFPEGDLKKKQTANLRKARAIVLERFPGLPVELFFVEADPAGSLQFIAIANT